MATKKTDNIVIIVDHREVRSGIVASLSAIEGLVIETAALTLGDYDLGRDGEGNGLYVERKTAFDFSQSIVDRRLFDQCAAYRKAAESSPTGLRAVYLIEGDIYATNRLKEAAVTGAISYLVAIERHSVFEAKNPAHSALLIATLARHHQQGLGYTLSLRGPRPKTLPEQQRFLIEGLPGVGPEKARLLLMAFGTPAGIFSASKQDMQAVKGIGPKFIDQLHILLNTPMNE